MVPVSRSHIDPSASFISQGSESATLLLEGAGSGLLSLRMKPVVPLAGIGIADHGTPQLRILEAWVIDLVIRDATPDAWSANRNRIGLAVATSGVFGRNGWLKDGHFRLPGRLRSWCSSDQSTCRQEQQCEKCFA